MIVITVRPENFGRLERRLGDGVRAVVQRGMRATGRDALKILRDQTALARIPAVSGGYVNGWRAQLRGDELRIFNAAPYAVYVEGGRQPGARMPPIDALIPWVRKVLGAPEDRIRQVAFLVARAIARRGIRPRPVMMKPVTRELIRKAFLRNMDREITRALRSAR